MGIFSNHMANLPTDQTNQARNLLKDIQSVLIVIGNNPNIDTVASGLALYLALTASGKQTAIVAPTNMTVEFSHLVGVDVIGNKINGQSGRNLVISFPYQEGSIEKVSYNIENETFNLVVEPREGYPIVTEEMMRYGYSGGSYDLIITVGATQLNQLNDLYNLNQSLFREKPIINIDIQSQNSRYGRVNFVDNGVSSVSELTVNLFSLLGFKLDTDIASNLLMGITEGSQNFTSNTTTATTFEAAAICLKNGARKSQTATSFQPSISQPTTFTPVAPKTSQVSPFINKPTPAMQSFQPNKKPAPVPIQQPSRSESTHPETPPDWLKPKIYKGSTLL